MIVDVYRILRGVFDCFEDKPIETVAMSIGVMVEHTLAQDSSTEGKLKILEDIGAGRGAYVYANETIGNFKMPKSEEELMLFIDNLIEAGLEATTREGMH